MCVETYTEFTLRIVEFLWFSLTAVCSPPCQHGGNCTVPNNCSCTTGWTGQLCERGTIYPIEKNIIAQFIFPEFLL